MVSAPFVNFQPKMLLQGSFRNQNRECVKSGRSIWSISGLSVWCQNEAVNLLCTVRLHVQSLKLFFKNT